MKVMFALIIFLGVIWIAIAARQQPLIVHAYGPDGVAKLHGYLK